jgi:hypothetical protein
MQSLRGAKSLVRLNGNALNCVTNTDALFLFRGILRLLRKLRTAARSDLLSCAFDTDRSSSRLQSFCFCVLAACLYRSDNFLSLIWLCNIHLEIFPFPTLLPQKREDNGGAGLELG